MSISIAARKQKARLLQQEVRDKILEVFPELTDRDVKSVPMGVIGEDIQLSEQASKLFPYSVECKATQSLSIWSALGQSNASNRNLTPILVFRRNFSPTYVALEFNKFMELIKINSPIWRERELRKLFPQVPIVIG